MACELYVNKVVFKKAELSKEIEGIFLSFLCSKESFLHSPGLVLACCSHKYTGTWGFVIQSILLYVSQRAYFAKYYTINYCRAAFMHSFISAKTFPNHQFCTRQASFHAGAMFAGGSQILSRGPSSHQGTSLSSEIQVHARELCSRQGMRFSPGIQVLTRESGSHRGSLFREML